MDQTEIKNVKKFNFIFLRSKEIVTSSNKFRSDLTGAAFRGEMSAKLPLASILMNPDEK